MIRFFEQLNWQGWLDVGLVVAVIILLFRIVKGTRVFHMFVGLGLILLLALSAQRAGLITGHWIISGFVAQALFVIMILFQPEIRRVLAQIGKMVLFKRSLSTIEETRPLEEIVRAVIPLGEKRIGAILVLERENELWDIVEMGIPLDAKVSRELLSSIFIPQSPLHDGAVVIRGDRILAAGSFLPLSLNPNIGKMLGTRHRAALGITEETDAVVITISEETGAISVIVDGKMTRDLDAAGLRRLLTRIFLREPRRLVWSAGRFKGFFPIRSKH